MQGGNETGGGKNQNGKTTKNQKQAATKARQIVCQV
jgi:hypothetical protein